MLARRADLIIEYKGVNITKDLSSHLSQFDYSDGEGMADDINIQLIDKDGRWHGPWLPQKFDEIKATIKTVNWKKGGEEQTLNCGSFYVDDVTFDGPPDKVSVKALSINSSKGGNKTKRSRAWEDTTLSVIASDVASANGLTIMLDAPNPHYDRVDQIRETDLSFIKRLARAEGIAIKVTKSMLVLYSERDYEAKSHAKTYTKGDWHIVNYSFEETAADEQYQKVVVKYFDAKKKKNINYTFNVPGIDEGPTLTINKRAQNIADAKRMAEAAARSKNKGAKTGKLTIVGDVDAVQGITVMVKGFRAFDGKYIIESSQHSLSGGYKTNIDIREVLDY